MYLTVTIDVEEDNWADYESAPVLSNIEKLNDLQKVFDNYRVTPTYLVSYPVAADQGAVSIIRRIMEGGGCEIGAHVHTWNTPPFEEEINARNTMLCNLDKELQYRKIESLHQMIYRNYQIEAVSFRSGRWGFDQNVARNIHKFGYQVDTSISPYMNWERCSGPDFSMHSPMPKRINIRNGGKVDSSILEVPATIGFIQTNYDFCNSIYQKISDKKLKHFRLRGLFDRLGILNKVRLSPETDNVENMIKLSESMGRNHFPVLNMFFHSPTLKHGLNHFTNTKEEEIEFWRRIENFLKFAERSNLKPIKLSETKKFLSESEILH